MPFRQSRKLVRSSPLRPLPPFTPPLSGTVLRVNEELQDHPELLNQDPYGRGWIAVLDLNNPSEVEQLMTSEQYEDFLKTQS